MLMTMDSTNRPVFRFITWCILYLFYWNLISTTVFSYAGPPDPESRIEISVGAVINSIMGLFASEAEAAYDDDIALPPEAAQGAVPNVDPYTGSFSSSYGIQVPPGRGGLAPQLALSYSSARQNGRLGVGWDLGIGCIERETKFGEPDWDDTDTFVMKMMGGSFTLILVDSENSEYRLKDESAFIRIVKSGDSWIATDKSGTDYYFGSTSDSRVGISTTFGWYLDKTEDANGNVVMFDYEKDNNQIYPKQVDYAVGNQVVLNWGWNRTDAPEMFNTFYSVRTYGILESVEVYHASNIVREYDLVYGTSPTTGRSRLDKIDLYGLGGSGGGTTPLTTTFNWQLGNSAFVNEGEWINGPYGAWADDGGTGPARTRAMDVDGNGLTDIVLGPDAYGKWYVLRSTGNGFVDEGAWISGAYAAWADPTGIPRTRSMDVNGDGLYDIVLGPDANGKWYVLRSTGNSFVNEGAWISGAYAVFEGSPDRIRAMDVDQDGMHDIVLGPTSAGEWFVLRSTGSSFVDEGAWITGAYGAWASGGGTGPARTRAMDVDGNGLTDIVLGPDTNGKWFVMLSTGSGFEDQGEWISGAFAAWGDLAGIARTRAMDVNGDGLCDILLGPDNNGAWFVMLATGSSFEDQGAWITGAYAAWASGGGTGPVRTRGMDVNGDKLPDIVLGPDTYGKWFVMLSTGNSFDDQGEWISSAYSQFGAARIRGVDVHGDGLADLVIGPNDYGQWFVLGTGDSETYPDLLSSVTSPSGSITTATYEPSSSWPNDYLPFIVQTVESITTTDNVNHSATVTYTYVDGKYEPIPREFRGFRVVTATESATGLKTETEYLQDDVYKGRVLWTKTTDSATHMVSRTDNTWNNIDFGQGRHFVYLEQSIVGKYDGINDITPMSTITTDFGYDTYGNLLYEDKQTSDGIRRFTRTEYNNDPTNWILGKPNRLRIAALDPDAGGTVLRETRMTYVSGSPWLLHKKKLIHNGAEYAVTTYGYGQYGNVTSEAGPRGCPTQITYDSNGMFPETTTNCLGHTINRTFDPKFGTVLTETDPNNQTVIYTYDEFGRKDTVTYPDGSAEGYIYNIAPGNHYVTVMATDSPTATVFFDNFGRKVREELDDGTDTIVKKTEYDDAGRVFRASLPYFQGSTDIDWTVNEYDTTRGYLKKQTNPDLTYKTIVQNGFQETITDENFHSRTITKDALGRLKEVQEPTGGITQYDYDLFDNMTYVKDPVGNETFIYYDDLGRKTSMDDPYMGFWEYDYDESGNLIWQKDAELREVNINYDLLNRIDYKTYVSDGRTVDYTYDEVRSGYHNIGALTTVTSPEATTQYNYDNMGRQVNETRTIDSVAYTTDRYYDLAGRLDDIIYPDGALYDYSYHPMGYLKEVKQGTHTLAYFTGHNALGQIGYETHNNAAVATTYTYKEDNYRLDTVVTSSTGTGVIQDLAYNFDNVGNVDTITDVLNSVDHLFVYDEVNRLTDAVATCPSDPSRQYDQIYAYDLAGNMTSKTGIGGWTINQFDSRKRPTEVAFDQSMAGVGQRQVTYNQDNKPTYIEYDGVGTDLYYDGEGNRVKKVSGSETVIYVGGIYEERGGQATSYVFANGKMIATLTGSHKYFQHTDHLGSTSLVTDENGDLVEEIGYLPFGVTLFRNAFQGGQWTSVYRFTGQEFDSEYHLYNYNARLYDPIMCRFITPDTVVPDWTNPQTLNRYSYCVNNPLKYIDPSGNLFVLDDILMGMAIGAFLGGATAAITGGNILEGMLTGAISGACFGAVHGLAAAGSMAQAGLHAAAGAVSGGINAAITGGNILQGMLIGGASGFLGTYVGGKLPADSFGAQLAGRMAVGALTGGVAAELAGGSFSDGAFQGAWTSAFAMICNDALTKAGKWIRKWVPEGPLRGNAKGEWKHPQTLDDNFVSAGLYGPGISDVTWSGKVERWQYGHYEYFGGRHIGKSYTRTWTMTIYYTVKGGAFTLPNGAYSIAGYGLVVSPPHRLWYYADNPGFHFRGEYDFSSRRFYDYD